MSLDIRSAGFIGCPKTDLPRLIKESGGKIGICGAGFVGGALKEYFKGKLEVLVYDKAKPELGTLQNVVKHAQVIFICVPTPMSLSDGSCFTGIVESVLEDIKLEAFKIGRPLDSFVVVIKSTCPPTFCEEMQAKHLPMRICFSPEFLTEKNAVNDMKNANRIVVAGDPDDTFVVCAFFYTVEETRANKGEVVIWEEPLTTVSELAKLFINGFLATKVTFCNEMYELCQKLGVDYNDVKNEVMLDPRIGISHMTVPGPLDNVRGFSGSCFIKDLSNLIYTSKILETKEKLFSAVFERNVEFRPEKDWEKLQGRAVINAK